MPTILFFLPYIFINKKTILKQEISDSIDSCSTKELETLTDILKASNIAFEIRLKTTGLAL